MYARCLFPILLLILIAGRNLILSDDRLYPTSRRLTKFEQLNRRTGDIHLRPKDTRRKMTKRSQRGERETSETKEVVREDCVSALRTTSLEHEDVNVINRFPGFFRDDIEEELFELLDNGTFQVQFSNRQMPYCKSDVIHLKYSIHNGCCSSQTVFQPFESLPLAASGLMVEVAQFSNYKQYFSIQECCQWSPCKFPCKCRQTNYVVTAVVKKKGKYSAELVRVPGICLCLNINHY